MQKHCVQEGAIRAEALREGAIRAEVLRAEAIRAEAIRAEAIRAEAISGEEMSEVFKRICNERRASAILKLLLEVLVNSIIRSGEIR